MSEGVKADVYVQRAWPESQEERDALLKQQSSALREEGMTWFRVTHLPEHGVVIIEGWKVRPEKEATFHPYLTGA